MLISGFSSVSREEAQARVAAMGQELREQERILKSQFAESLSQSQATCAAAQVHPPVDHELDGGRHLIASAVTHQVFCRAGLSQALSYSLGCTWTLSPAL